MTAYVIFTIDVKNPQRYADYAKHTPRIINQYGGKMLVRGGEPEALEGALPASRVVVLEFKDRASAKRFVASPEYAKIIGIRQEASQGAGLVVDGLADDAWAAMVTESNKHG